MQCDAWSYLWNQAEKEQLEPVQSIHLSQPEDAHLEWFLAAFVTDKVGKDGPANARVVPICSVRAPPGTQCQ